MLKVPPLGLAKAELDFMIVPPRRIARRTGDAASATAHARGNRDHRRRTIYTPLVRHHHLLAATSGDDAYIIINDD